MSDSRFEDSTPYSVAILQDLETQLGRKLSDDFRKFALSTGGCFIGGAVDGNDEFPILEIYGPREIVDNLKLFSEYADIGALIFGICGFGNPYVLTVDNKVLFMVNYAGKSEVKHVADSFQNFIDRIVVSD